MNNSQEIIYIYILQLKKCNQLRIREGYILIKSSSTGAMKSNLLSYAYK